MNYRMLYLSSYIYDVNHVRLESSVVSISSMAIEEPGTLPSMVNRFGQSRLLPQ